MGDEYITLSRAKLNELRAEAFLAGCKVGYGDKLQANDQAEADAYDQGYEHGDAEGYDKGYNDGCADAYDDGFEDGHAEGQLRAAEVAAYDAAFDEQPRIHEWVEGTRFVD